jgi:hypothetical protein
MADEMTGDDKSKMLEIAEGWLKLADEAAKPTGNRASTGQYEKRHIHAASRRDRMIACSALPHAGN